MSLWLSETKTVGLWKGGLWKSQQGSPYAFNLDLTTGKDTVSGLALSCAIAGTRYDEVGGVTTAFAENVPTICDKGLRTVGTYSNLLKYSEALSNATWAKSKLTANNNQLIPNSENVAHYLYQTITLDDVGIFSADVKKESSNMTYLRLQGASTFAYFYNLDTLQTTIDTGTSNVSITNITADYKRCTINPLISLSGEYTFRIYTVNNNSLIRTYAGDGVTVASTIRKAQLSKKKYVLPYIPTTTDPRTSLSESGGSSLGVWIDDIQTKHPLLYSVLNTGGKGTLSLKWRPGFNDADVSGNLNILSFNGTTTSAISYDADNNRIALTDGTNTATKSLTCVADTEYTIIATWGLVSGSPKMQVSVNGTAGTQATFAGTFSPGSDVVFGLSNAELQYLKDVKVYKEPIW